jgi:hypothetical protein
MAGMVLGVMDLNGILLMPLRFSLGLDSCYFCFTAGTLEYTTFTKIVCGGSPIVVLKNIPQLQIPFRGFHCQSGNCRFDVLSSTLPAMSCIREKKSMVWLSVWWHWFIIRHYGGDVP